jgi:SpoIID/LytB domain protein
MRRLSAIALLAVTPMAMSTVSSGSSVAAVRPSTAQPAASTASVVLDGHGWGHGIGLSQWGAYGYAVDFGWSASQILDRYYGGTLPGTVDASTTTTVRLQALDDAQTAVISDSGALTVDGVASGPWKSLVARETGAATYTVWGRTDQLVCPGATDDLGGWTVVATGLTPSVTFRTPQDGSSPYSQLVSVCEPGGKVRAYRGTIRAVNGSVGENRTVNEVMVEQYLRSVIAKEMSPSWATAGGGRGAQALQAQAVAARSYGLAESRYTYARTCDEVCQTYQGAAVRTGVGGAFTAVEHPFTDAAVVATAGVVRRTAGGAIAYTMFSASSGGYTSPSTLGFTPQPDEGDATSLNPNHDWSASIAAATIEAAYPAIGTFTGLAVTAQNGLGDGGGRVDSVTVSGTASAVTVTGDQLRVALGLKSNWFSVRNQDPPLPLESVASGAAAAAAARRLGAVKP